MTFAEIIVFILLIVAVAFALSPLQKRLEKKLYTFFRSKNQSSNNNSTIDVTNSIKKEPEDE